MPQQRPTTRAERLAKEPATIPGRFVPKFWDDADKRQGAIKEIKRRYELLRDDCSATSYQKDLLAQRAVFISLQLETAEIAAMEGEEFNPNAYTCAVNCLLGLLRALGLEKKAAQVVDLQGYLREQAQ